MACTPPNVRMRERSLACNTVAHQRASWLSSCGTALYPTLCASPETVGPHRYSAGAEISTRGVANALFVRAVATPRTWLLALFGPQTSGPQTAPKRPGTGLRRAWCIMKERCWGQCKREKLCCHCPGEAQLSCKCFSSRRPPNLYDQQDQARGCGGHVAAPCGRVVGGDAGRETLRHKDWLCDGPGRCNSFFSNVEAGIGAIQWLQFRIASKRIESKVNPEPFPAE